MKFSILLVDGSNLRRLMAVPIHCFFFLLLYDLSKFIYRFDMSFEKSSIAIQHKSTFFAALELK